MAGRPRKPTALKVIEGNRGKRATPVGEPDPDYLNDLTPPAWMPAHIAAVWSEIAPHLRAAKVLTVLDVPMLEQLCDAVAEFRQAAIESAEKKMMHNPETGAFSPSPWLIIKSMANKRAIAAMREFGMTPAARSRVMIQPQGDLFAHENKAANYFQ